jgi:glycosyltransferase involved in cell wall biosynthesis
MKILFLNIYQSQVDRGLETFVREVSERLRKNNEVDVIGAKKMPPKRWPDLWRAFLDPQSISIFWFTFKCLPIIFMNRYDIVVPLNGGWQSALVRFATWLYGGKVVISGQSGMGWDDRNNLWCLPNTFVALSNKALGWSKKAMPFTKSVYIPNGVNTKKFKPNSKKLGTKLKEPIVLCVGALEKTKRINLTIKAVAKMKDVSLLVVGDGELGEQLGVTGNRLLGNRFKIMKLPHELMPEVYRAADVFTIASESYYSFEIVLVEAMASGLPVVANDDEIRAEIVGNGGLLVDPTDTNKYAKTLRKALKKNWGDKPRKQATMFDWDLIAKKYETLFKSLTK